MAELIELPTIIDSRGSLTVIDGLLPFEIKRVYYIYNVQGERGGHRHKVARQCLIALVGKCTVHVNNGQTLVGFELSRPDLGLIIEPEDWHTMDGFSTGAVLLVLASHPYERSDYIDEPYP